MPELLLGEKARCSLVRVIEIRQSLLSAGVCLAQFTSQLIITVQQPHLVANLLPSYSRGRQEGGGTLQGTGGMG